MKNQEKVRLIRVIVWIGVLADGVWAAALVWPDFYSLMTGRPLESLSLILRLAMGVGSSLMAGWTILLIWVAQQPVERRVVILITAVPVIAGLFCTAVIGAVNGNAHIWLPFKCIFLFAAMLYGYYLACTVAATAYLENRP